jgi:cytoskeletal protein CcmA (bactofilin family)
MGKNPNEEKSPTETSTAADNYAQRAYPPYQSAEQKSLETPAGSRALTESETIAREIKDGTLSGFVGSGTTVTGESTFKSMLRIDGRFSGRITSSGGTLLVGAGGQVEANIEVAVATIQGIVNGDVIASDRIELGRAAKLQGNIQTPSLIIEQGAVFEGSCKMTEQKTAAETSKVERKSNVIDSARLEPAKVADALNKKLDEGAVKRPEVIAAAR